MDVRKLATVFAGLGLAGSGACNKGGADATAVPHAADSASHVDAQGEGEHACGNHADGACGGDTKGAASAPASKGFEIEAGKFAELNMKMEAGSSVTATFSRADHALSWNIHSHTHDGGTQIHAEGTGAEGEIRFTAPEDGVFSILWKNEAGAPTPLDVDATLSEGASVHSWTPE